MNRRLKYMNEKGFTLIEIIIVIVVLGIVSGVTFQIVASGVQAFKKSSARKELYDQGRLALERMVRELRDAKEITATSSDSITFNKVHKSAQDSAEEIKFQRNGANLERIADPSGSALQAVLAANVDTFQVTIGGTGAGGGENWGRDQQNSSSTTSVFVRCMGGTSPDKDDMKIKSISTFLGTTTGEVRLGVYTGGSLYAGPEGASVIWDAGKVSGSGLQTIQASGDGIDWPKNTVTWLCFNKSSREIYMESNSGGAGDFQTARGRFDSTAITEDPNTAWPATFPSGGSFNNYWYSIYVTSGVSGTAVVTLELTLSSPEGGSVSMRTKVYMRNVS